MSGGCRKALTILQRARVLNPQAVASALSIVPPIPNAAAASPAEKRDGTGGAGCQLALKTGNGALAVPKRISVREFAEIIPQTLKPPEALDSFPNGRLVADILRKASSNSTDCEIAGLGESAATTGLQKKETKVLVSVVLGPANAGKSTLVNALVAAHVSPVSCRAHSTREKVNGVATLEDGVTQLVFTDTPGIASKKYDTNSHVSSIAWAAARESVHRIAVLDGAKLFALGGTVEAYFLARLHATLAEQSKDIFNSRNGGNVSSGIPDDNDEVNVNGNVGGTVGGVVPPTTFVVTKIDEIRRMGVSGRLRNDTGSANLAAATAAALTRRLGRLRRPESDRVFAVSAATGEGIDELRDYLAMRAVVGPHVYESDVRGDAAPLQMMERLVRHAFFDRLYGYIPYILRQKTQHWDLRDDSLTAVHQVTVDRSSQLKIVVGTKGSVVIGVQEEVRRRMEELLQRPVSLYVEAKVRDAPDYTMT